MTVGEVEAERVVPFELSQPCPNDVCPVPPDVTASVPEMFARVVVATHVGTPFRYASTYPAVPAVVVAIAPVPLPYGIEPD